MRFTAILPALAFAASTTAWSDYENAVKCGQKNPAVNAAIERFCAKGDIVVPSLYARSGLAIGNAHVAISGKCSPPQWVPTSYCRMQFAKLCANGNGKGFGHTKYGRNACQGWHIAAAKGPHKRDAEAHAEAMAYAHAEPMTEAEADAEAMAMPELEEEEEEDEEL